jgi:hypothetical protein
MKFETKKPECSKIPESLFPPLNFDWEIEFYRKEQFIEEQMLYIYHLSTDILLSVKLKHLDPALFLGFNNTCQVPCHGQMNWV